MKVRIKVRPTGLIGGIEWPDVGKVIDLPDHVADGMVASGHVEVVDSKAVETRPASTKNVESRSPRKKGSAK